MATEARYGTIADPDASTSPSARGTTARDGSGAEEVPQELRMFLWILLEHLRINALVVTSAFKTMFRDKCTSATLPNVIAEQFAMPILRPAATIDAAETV